MHITIVHYLIQWLSMEKKNVCLTYANLCKDSVYVMIDRDQFARVLINVAENSAKYKKNDIGSLYIAVTEQDGEAIIALKDDGIGVHSSMVGKIFDSFYRDDPARTNPIKGSGLGLSIAKQIVTSHGGRIWAESNVGEGLTVYISLPTDGVIVSIKDGVYNGK